MRVSIFDYGAGNLHSLAKGLERGGAKVEITGDWSRALGADALILPGVGSFGAAVRALEGREELVREALDGGLPCLGVCLGMQLLFAESDEATGSGIGLIPGRVRALEVSTVPQMGWNDVSFGGGTGDSDDPLFSGLGSLTAYYANSYTCDPEDPDVVIAESEVDGFVFPAAVRRGNTWGVQFHPEKSSAPGLRLIRNFLVSAGLSGQRS